MKQVKILIVDDRPEGGAALAHAVAVTLAGDLVEVEIVAATDPEGLALHLDGGICDAVLIELGLQWIPWLVVLRRVRELWPTVSVVVCGTRDNDLLTARAVAAGADLFALRDDQGCGRVSEALHALIGRGAEPASAPWSENGYQDLFETMPAALFLSDEQGCLLDVNQAMVEVLAYPDRETLLGTNSRELYVEPDLRDLWRDRLKREGVVRGFEARLKRHDGAVIWMRESSRLIQHGGDGTVVFQGVFEDITPLKEAENALWESQRILETLLSNLPGMAYRCRNDEAWTMDFVSQGCRKLTGYGPADLVDNRTVVFADLIHPEDRQLVWQQVQEAVATHSQFQISYRIIDAQEKQRWVAEQGRGIFSDSEELLFLEGFITDVSEQRAAERAVRDSEAWYRTLFESANDAIFLMDGERFVDCNSTTLQFFGCTVDQIVGRNPADFSPPVQPDGSDSLTASLHWVEAALRGDPQVFEWQHLKADGTPFDVEVNLNRVEVAGRVYLQAIVRDITDRKVAEKALERRDAILEAVSFAAAKFLKAPNWESLAGEVLAHFGRAADAGRVYLFEGYRSEDGVMLARQRFEWAAPGVETRHDKPGMQRLAAAEEGLAQWVDAITVGGMIHGPRSSFGPSERAFLETQSVMAVVVVPVFVGGELWGFLGVDECRHERTWSDGEIEAIRAAAEILGGAIYLDSARRAVQKRAEELEILNRVTTMLASTLDATSVMQEIAEIVRIRCGVDHVSVAMIDDSGGTLDFVAWSGYDAPQRESGMAVDGPGLIARTAREGRAVWVADVQSSEEYLAGDDRVRAEFSVPLMLNGETMGVLNCESFAIDGIGVWQRDVIDRLASQAAIALRNAEIYRSLDAAEGQ